jgi:NAD(P)-dependent dehydrogenase (short-subunit alcohol dehydrogenase family)
MVELESTGIKVNLVSPGFTKTNLNGYEGTESVKDGSREVVRVALLGPDGPAGTFTHWETQPFLGELLGKSPPNCSKNNGMVVEIEALSRISPTKIAASRRPSDVHMQLDPRENWE